MFSQRLVKLMRGEGCKDLGYVEIKENVKRVSKCCNSGLELW